MAECLPCRRAIDLGRLQDLAWNSLQTSEEKHHHEWNGVPSVHNHDIQSRQPWIFVKRDVLEAEPLEGWDNRSVLAVEQRPANHEADGDRTQHEWQKKDHPEELASANLLI